MKNKQTYKKKETHTQRERCQNFESLPGFMKQGYYLNHRLKAVRAQNFKQQYLISVTLKERGNRFYLLGYHKSALNEYESSLAIFQYIEKIKYDNAQTDDLYFVRFKGQSLMEQDQIKDLKLKLYNNLAACYLKQMLHEDVVRACDYTIALDENQIKAYYRRAKAQLILGEVNNNLDKIQNCLTDLRIANKLDPADKDVARELVKVTAMLTQPPKNVKSVPETKIPTKQTPYLKPKPKSTCEQTVIEENKQEKKKQDIYYEIKIDKYGSKCELVSAKPLQETKDLAKTFTPDQIIQVNSSKLQVDTCEDSSSSDSEPRFQLKNRSTMTNKQASDFWLQFDIKKDYDNLNYELSYEEDETRPIPKEVDELGDFIEFKGAQMLRNYEIQGRMQEVEELKEKLRKALAAKVQLEKISRLDFSRPKEVFRFYNYIIQHLQKIANQYGIDLLDESVQNEFRRIQQQNIDDIRLWLKQNQKHAQKSIKTKKQGSKTTVTIKLNNTQITEQNVTTQNNTFKFPKKRIQADVQATMSAEQQSIKECFMQGQGGQCDEKGKSENLTNQEVEIKQISNIYQVQVLKQDKQAQLEYTVVEPITLEQICSNNNLIPIEDQQNQLIVHKQQQSEVSLKPRLSRSNLILIAQICLIGVISIALERLLQYSF